LARYKRLLLDGLNGARAFGWSGKLAASTASYRIRTAGSAIPVVAGEWRIRSVLRHKADRPYPEFPPRMPLPRDIQAPLATYKEMQLEKRNNPRILEYVALTGPWCRR